MTRSVFGKNYVDYSKFNKYLLNKKSLRKVKKMLEEFENQLSKKENRAKLKEVVLEIGHLEGADNVLKLSSNALRKWVNIIVELSERAIVRRQLARNVGRRDFIVGMIMQYQKDNGEWILVSVVNIKDDGRFNVVPFSDNARPILIDPIIDKGRLNC